MEFIVSSNGCKSSLALGTHRVITSDVGSVALGLSYSYTHRTVWSGANGVRPWGEEHTIMTTVRYYLP